MQTLLPAAPDSLCRLMAQVCPVYCQSLCLQVMWGSTGLAVDVQALAGFSLQTFEQQLAKNNELKATAKLGETTTLTRAY